jgi:hypothetical protein
MSVGELSEVSVSEITFLVEVDPEGGYSARAVGHSIFTDADSWTELVEAVREAVACHFDDREEKGLSVNWEWRR